MAAAIVFETGEGGNGNPVDKFVIHGTGWTVGETIAANSITVNNAATTHAARTVDSSGNFSSLLVSITAAITTVGEYDVKVTGSVTGATTFSGYWTVSAGAGLNDMYRIGDISGSYGESVILQAIADALDWYNGMLYGVFSSSDIPHTLGAYPKAAIRIIALYASSQIFADRGGEEYATKSEVFEKRALGLIGDIKRKALSLYKPDGTRLTFVGTSQYEAVGHTGNFDVTNYHDEDLYDDGTG